MRLHHIYTYTKFIPLAKVYIMYFRFRVIISIAIAWSLCSVELKSTVASSQTSLQTTEFGAPPATSVMITENTKKDLKIEPKTLQISASTVAENGKTKDDQFGDSAEDSMPSYHYSKRISLNEVSNKIKLQKIVLGVILCTLTIGISVPVGIFVARILLDEDSDASAVELHIHQNYCRIHDSSMDIELVDLYHDSCEVYEGSICDTYLLTGEQTNVTTLQSMITSEQDLVAFFDVLDNNPNIVTEECNKAAKPLLCHYTYPVCAHNESYQFPTREECQRVRDVSCATEWQIALAIMPDTLPNCDLLVAMDEELEIQSNMSRNEAPTCPTHFELFCNETCLPLCSSFSDYSESVASSRSMADVSASVLAIIGGILLITISILRRDSMFKYPTIFVVYSSLCPMVLGILLLITYFRRDLYCTSEILTEALIQPSTFCRLAGVLTHFTILLNVFFWFLHLFHLYLNVLFPLKFLLLKDKRWEKRLHIAELIASVGFSSLGPAIVWISNNDYNMFTRPPLLCLPAPNSMLLYTLCVPILVLLIIGVNLIATIVWALLKRYCHFNGPSMKGQRKLLKCKMATITPEVKMLILLCYFLVFTAVLSAHIIVSIQQTQPITEGIYAYFLCQLNGANPNCDELQEEFRQHLTPNVTSTTFIMIGLINWVYLIFPFHYKDIEFIISRATNSIHRLYKSSIDSTVRSRDNSSV